MEIIGNLLGVPHADRGAAARLVAGDPGRAGAQAHAGAGSAGQPQRDASSLAYLRDLVAERRQQPGDPEHDVLTRLIQGEEAASS